MSKEINDVIREDLMDDLTKTSEKLFSLIREAQEAIQILKSLSTDTEESLKAKELKEKAREQRESYKEFRQSAPSQVFGTKERKQDALKRIDKETEERLNKTREAFDKQYSIDEILKKNKNHDVVAISEEEPKYIHETDEERIERYKEFLKGQQEMNDLLKEEYLAFKERQNIKSFNPLNCLFNDERIDRHAKDFKCLANPKLRNIKYYEDRNLLKEENERLYITPNIRKIKRR